MGLFGCIASAKMFSFYLDYPGCTKEESDIEASDFPNNAYNGIYELLKHKSFVNFFDQNCPLL